MLMEADLPSDVKALRALVLKQAQELDALKVFQAEVERLKAIIEALNADGSAVEQLDPDQFELLSRRGRGGTRPGRACPG